ncbi:hypothetical protein IC757_12325 [Wenzhouxiangella sp. AB-CW3]|uniref:hypothetical protein n=1 Tax=Wenzhouxiangella sp. AB-CW3 TaxID=2771012 RepID=UPI00168B9AC5|nr:hypothetical protein [Wenzhouxiangella sp. AB-CW3]QOC21814.1 hypothetical protein IC757_12325 [Wenzhouxiangella sp. AB-CW3]
MNDSTKAKFRMVRIGLLSLGLVTAITLGWWLTFEPQGLTGKHESLLVEPVPNDADEQIGMVDSLGSAEDSLGFKRRVVTTTDEVRQVQPGPDPFSSGERLVEIFAQASSLYGWTDREERANLAQWARYCEKAEPYSRATVRVDELRKVVPGSDELVNFARLCAGFSEEIILGFEGRSSGDVEEFPSHEYQSRVLERDEIRELHHANSTDYALELVMNRLDQALKRIDENGVHGALGAMIMSGSELIAPPISSDPDTLVYYTPMMTWLVGKALICAELGGCRGQHHPMVLRHCVSMIESSPGCYQPIDIFDAIYQTSTPIEYKAFTAFYEQVATQLAMYRRR